MTAPRYYPSFNVVSRRGREGWGAARALTPQAFSATRSLTGLWTGAKTGLPSFSFFAMAPMQQSAAIATTAAAMRPPTSPASSLLHRSGPLDVRLREGQFQR